MKTVCHDCGTSRSSASGISHPNRKRTVDDVWSSKTRRNAARTVCRQSPWQQNGHLMRDPK
jgi:hypothetical protein